MRWYENMEQYTNPAGLPLQFPAYWDLALVHVYDDSATTTGWGRESFMKNLVAGKFRPQGYLKRFGHGRAFGIVMRSVPLLCIDIDGKNGGFQAARVLELPPTLAETSKSGNGLHLFYQVPGEVNWHEKYGYEEVPDVIGLLPGVDVKATGIVYHYPQQRWNGAEIAFAPTGVMRLLDSRKRTLELSKQRVQASKLLDPEERAILADELMDELQRPLPDGRRNTTLFAWGCKADGVVKDWPLHLHLRGEQARLSSSELVQIIKSVQSYRSSESP